MNASMAPSAVGSNSRRVPWRRSGRWTSRGAPRRFPTSGSARIAKSASSPRRSSRSCRSWSGSAADGFKAVNYTQLPPLAIPALKELKSQNDPRGQRRGADSAARGARSRRPP